MYAIVFLAYGPDGGRQALDIAGTPNASGLERAGRCGLDDPTLASRALDLCTLAVSQCSMLGSDFVSGEVLERASDYFDRFTRARRAPARPSTAGLEPPAARAPSSPHLLAGGDGARDNAAGLGRDREPGNVGCGAGAICHIAGRVAGRPSPC